MWLVMGFRIMSPNRVNRKTQAGLTLMECLVSMGVSSLVLMMILMLTLYSGRGFASLVNYVDLNTTGANAMDQMTKDIRQAVALTGYASNKLTFDAGSNQPAIIFTYNPTNSTLTRQQGSSSKVLLSGCDTLVFAIYQGTPIPGTYDQYPVADTNTCKVVAVN